MGSRVILPSILMLVCLSAPAFAASNANMVGARAGYTFDVGAEKSETSSELVMIDEPTPVPTLNEKLFDPKLSKDIRDQYEARFGRTAMEQTMNAPQNRETAYWYNGDPTVTADKYQQYQRSFGEYVGRKVMENQIDKFFKSEPSLTPVYQLKDRLSNASVQTKAGYKFSWHHNISGNSSEFEMENPYHIETKFMIQFAGFSTLTEEETLSLAYPINPIYRVSAHYKFYDGMLQVVGTRRINSELSAFLSSSATTTAQGPSVRQTMGLIGLSWTQ